MSPASSDRHPAGRSGDHGQAAIEVALALPLVILAVLAVVQFAVIVSDVLLVQLAAREGARAGAVAGSPGGAARAASRRVLGDHGTVDVAVGGGVVRVTASRTNPTDVPLIGSLLPDVTVDATVTMAVEPP